MNPYTGETPNPFSNAKVVSVNTDPAKYHAMGGQRGRLDFVMSRSELMEFRACPQRWLRGFKDDGTTATEFGDLFDCMLLSPQQFDQRFAVCPEKYQDQKTGEMKDWTFAATVCKKWREDHQGKTVIKHGVHAEADAACKRVLDDPTNAEFLRSCARQVLVVGEYHDEATGIVVPVKAMLDAVPNANHQLYGKCLADVKTSTAAGERIWSKFVADRGYHVQGAVYTDLYVAATGEDRNTFLHLIVENYSPWEFARSWLTMEFVELGRMFYISALRDYCQCLKSKEWPGYNRPDNSFEVLPGWRKCEPPMYLVTQSIGSVSNF